MRRRLAGLLTAGSARPGGMERIAPDEEVLFFPGIARQTAAGSWEATIHGWVFQPERGSLKRRALLRLLAKLLRLGDEDVEQLAGRELFKQRAGAFLVDNQGGKRITIVIGPRSHTLDASSPNGHFSGTLLLDREIVQRLGGDVGTIPFATAALAGDPRRFNGEIRLLADHGVSVVSDIDDTIKVTDCRDRAALMRNSFVLPYRPVSGMATLYRGWAAQGARFHYVSASPWQLYAPLAAFAAEQGFPGGSWHLKQFRWKDETFWDLFAAPEAHKRAALAALLELFPSRRFVLVGDSGQDDPEIYGALARTSPGSIARILIRDLDGATADAARYHAAFAGLPGALWRVFAHPDELADERLVQHVQP